MTKAKHPAPPITDADEADIQDGIARDPDAAELTDDQLAQMRPASEALPPALFKALTKRGRPKSEAPKELLTLRVDPDVIAAYRATGAGWQTRMTDVLAKAAPKAPARHPGKPQS